MTGLLSSKSPSQTMVPLWPYFNKFGDGDAVGPSNLHQLDQKDTPQKKTGATDVLVAGLLLVDAVKGVNGKGG